MSFDVMGLVLVFIGQGVGLLPDSTKPLLEPVTTYRQRDPLRRVEIKLRYLFASCPHCNDVYKSDALYHHHTEVLVW